MFFIFVCICWSLPLCCRNKVVLNWIKLMLRSQNKMFSQIPGEKVIVFSPLLSVHLEMRFDSSCASHLQADHSSTTPTARRIFSSASLHSLSGFCFLFFPILYPAHPQFISCVLCPSSFLAKVFLSPPVSTHWFILVQPPAVSRLTHPPLSPASPPLHQPSILLFMRALSLSVGPSPEGK